jgi:hypothetical protein
MKDLYYLQGNLAKKMWEENQDASAKRGIQMLTEVLKLYGLEVDGGIRKALPPPRPTLPCPIEPVPRVANRSSHNFPPKPPPRSS